MTFFDLSTKLINLREATTMANITYLPSGVGMVKAAIRDLARLKQDWNIDILEDKRGRNVVFEDALSILVSHAHWNEFSDLFDSSLELGSIGLGKYLQEAFEEELDDLRTNIKPAITKLYSGEEFEAADESTALWKAWFGVSGYRPTKTAVDIKYREKDIQELTLKLHKVYGKDKGNLELLLEAFRDRQPLNTFEVLKKYDFLYGVHIQSNYHGTILGFECTIDMSYLPAQTIVITDWDVVDKLEELDRNIKLVRNVVYPRGGTFTSANFKNLKNALEEAHDNYSMEDELPEEE